MYFVRITDNDGYFIGEDFTDDLTDHTVTATCPSGLYRPRWDGERWTEGGAAPEPQPREQIDEAKAQLAVTDYRIIKCYEYALAGLSLPYDTARLHAERQALRDLINALGG